MCAVARAEQVNEAEHPSRLKVRTGRGRVTPHRRIMRITGKRTAVKLAVLSAAVAAGLALRCGMTSQCKDETGHTSADSASGG